MRAVSALMTSSLGRLRDRQIRRLLSLEDAVDMDGGGEYCIRLPPITHEAAGRGKFSKLEDRRHRAWEAQRSVRAG